ncbi:sensor histidine kinase [Spirillospora sp. CA-294931]|uniref:sensor histidine kinase n=1 Tax=Spirillospora sp. CA-294931 TaxID=3240042 RepID=UPI003D8CC529
MIGPRDTDRHLVRRARRAVAAQIAGTISLVLVLGGILVYAVAAGGQEPPATAGRAEIGGRPHFVRAPDDVTVQAGHDLQRRDEQRRRLLYALGIAELAGLLGALLAGQVFARRAIAPLGAALEQRRRFVADAAHELRAPLTRQHTRAQLIAHRLRQGTATADEVDRLVAGTRQFGEVVDDLLRSARFGHTRGPGGPVDLAALAEEAAREDLPRAAARGVTIEVRREGRGPHVVSGAESALRRVIATLLDNALRHTGRHVRLTVTGGPMVALTVQDDGSGLEAPNPDRLFTRFAGSPRGTGLGLALAREVASAHGGTLTAASSGGAIFTLHLPAATAPRPPRRFLVPLPRTRR